MVDGTLRWVLKHEKRSWIVITLTFMTGLLLILPAVEEYSAAKQRLQAAQEKLESANLQLQNLPQLQRIFEQKKRELQVLENKAVAAKDVETLRETLHTLIRETGCLMRQFDIMDATQRTWMSNDSPTKKPGTLGDPGPETPFLLVSRNVKLQLDGPMGNLYQFIARVNRLDRFMHLKHIELNRSQSDENVTQLIMQFEMFDLVRKSEPKL